MQKKMSALLLEGKFFISSGLSSSCSIGVLFIWVLSGTWNQPPIRARIHSIFPVKLGGVGQLAEI